MVPYVMRRSRRSRYLRLSLNREKQALLTLPMGFSEKQALEFLREKADWVGQQLETKVKRIAEILPHLQKKPHLSYCGIKADLRIGFTDSKPSISWNEEKRTVDLSLNSKKPLEEQLVNLLRRFASKVIPQHTYRVAEKLDLEVGRVSVRDQSTRWGSCSGRKTVSLNWRLILLPPELHDYVIAHELAHLTHFDHSQAFWDLLKTYHGKALTHDRRLSRMGEAIMNLGRSKRVSEVSV